MVEEIDRVWHGGKEVNKEHAKSEQVFPDEWRHARFGDVATLQRGFDLPVQDRTPGLSPVIGSNGIVGYHNEPKIPGPGVVIGRSGTIGKSFYTEREYWPLNTGLYVKDFHGNDPLFIHFFFQVFDFGKYSAGVSVPTLNRNLVHEAPVYIPPLFEQRAIAAVLSKIQAAVEVQDKVVAKLKELKAATMAKLFREGLRGEPLKQTKIGEVPESWKLVELGDIAKIGNGSTPNRSNEMYWKNGTIPWITSTKVHETIIREANEFVTNMAKKECHLPLVPKGSIVVAITGQGKTLGNAAIVAFDTCVNQHLAYATFHDPNVLPEFVLLYLQTQYQNLRQASRGGGTTKGALTCGYLEKYPIPVPRIHEQREILHIIFPLHRKLEVAESRKSTFKTLFTSMLHLLMAG